MIIEVNMPLMNGFEFIETFRALPFADEKRAKIIILTSSVRHGKSQNAWSRFYNENAYPQRMQGLFNKPIAAETGTSIVLR